MPNCGIKKYDDLPSRVGLIDVDALRYELYINLKKEIMNTKQRKLILDELDKVLNKVQKK